jgi:hypothetical protein
MEFGNADPAYFRKLAWLPAELTPRPPPPIASNAVVGPEPRV